MPETKSDPLLTTETVPYLVGDIHGCYHEYLELETRILQHARQTGVQPLIVSVGDLVDRGPDSAAVVDHFMRGREQGSHQAILGNHELMMLQVVHYLAPWNFEQPGCAWPLLHWTLVEMHAHGDGMARYLPWEDYAVMMKAMWLGQGGYQTLESYGMDPHRSGTWHFRPEVLQFLLALPLYWQQDDVVATHALAEAEDLALIRQASAGGLSLDEENLLALKLASHSLIWNRKLPAHRPDPERQHISGHTPIPRIRRWRLKHCVQIDTGCVYGKRLTAFCPASNQSISVAAQRNYLSPH